MVNSSLASGAASRRYRRKASPLGKMHRHRRAPYFDTYDPCGDYHVVDYLNRRDVQDALHANVSGSIPSTWQPCSDALTNWTDQPASTLPEIAGLVGKAGIRVWVLSGDTDDRVPVTSTRYALRKLGLKTVKPWKEWFTSDQVGGYTVVDDGGLTFVTVRGAGHMVPMITPVHKLHESAFKKYRTKSTCFGNKCRWNVMTNFFRTLVRFCYSPRPELTNVYFYIRQLIRDRENI